MRVFLPVATLEGESARCLVELRVRLFSEAVDGERLLEGTQLAQQISRRMRSRTTRRAIELKKDEGFFFFCSRKVARNVDGDDDEERPSSFLKESKQKQDLFSLQSSSTSLFF
jgi:hypothetical protein